MLVVLYTLSHEPTDPYKIKLVSVCAQRLATSFQLSEDSQGMLLVAGQTPSPGGRQPTVNTTKHQVSLTSRVQCDSRQFKLSTNPGTLGYPKEEKRGFAFLSHCHSQTEAFHSVLFLNNDPVS